MLEIKLPKHVQFIMNKLHSKNFESYIVGGCVRDSLIGVEPKDWDITTSATPKQIKKVFNGHKLLLMGEKYGTVSVVLDGEPYEITTFRKDGNYSDGRRPDSVNYSDDIVDDLSRRDFTINAIAYNDTEGIVDPFNGAEDIYSRVLRCVGEPKLRFTEDTLRVLRCARFACKYDLKIEKETYKQMMYGLKFIHKCSKERIGNEFRQIIEYCKFNNRHFVDKIALEVVPELKEMVGFYQYNPNHVSDLFEHTMNAVCAVESDIDNYWQIKMALLLHDLGKLETFEIDDNGIGHFYGHAVNSERMAREVLTRLKFTNKDKEFICKMIYFHDIHLGTSLRSIKRAALKIKGYNNLLSLIEVKIADDSAKRESIVVKRLSDLRFVHDQVIGLKDSEDCLSLSSLAINGEDVMCLLDIQPSVKVKIVLDKLLQLVVDGNVDNSRKSLILEVQRSGLEWVS